MPIKKYEYKPPGGPQPGSVSPEAQGWEALANTLNSWSDMFYQQAGDIAKQEGARAGLNDSYLDNPELEDWGTIYGQAYNTQLLKGYADKTETNLKTKLEQLAAEYPSDPQTFQEQANEYYKGLAEGVNNPAFTQIIKQKFDDKMAITLPPIYKSFKDIEFAKAVLSTEELWEKDKTDLTKLTQLSIKNLFTEEFSEQGNKNFGFGLEKIRGQFIDIENKAREIMSMPKGWSNERANKEINDLIVDFAYSALEEELRQQTLDGNGTATFQEMSRDIVSYIRSKDYLNELLTDDLLEGLSPDVKDIVIGQLKKYWSNDNAATEALYKQEQRALEAQQDSNFMDTFLKVAGRDKNVTLDSITKEITAEPGKYNEDDAKFLINALTEGKYDTDDKQSLLDLNLYLMTSTESQADKQKTIMEYHTDKRISTDSAIKLIDNLRKGTQTDVTKNPNFQRAVSMLKPAFQRDYGDLGAFAKGIDKQYMEEAITELMLRTQKGEDPLTIWREVQDQFLGQVVDADPQGLVRELVEGPDGRPTARVNCKKSYDQIESAFAAHGNIRIKAAEMKNYLKYCTIEEATDVGN